MRPQIKFALDIFQLTGKFVMALSIGLRVGFELLVNRLDLLQAGLCLVIRRCRLLYGAGLVSSGAIIRSQVIAM